MNAEAKGLVHKVSGKMYTAQCERRMAGVLPACAVPAADDYLVVRIREALRDRQAAMASGELGGGAVMVES
jgi:hypothetical protein